MSQRVRSRSADRQLFLRVNRRGSGCRSPVAYDMFIICKSSTPAIQNRLKECIAVQDEVTKSLAREFIIIVRKPLTEKGIQLDRGNRDLSRLLEVRLSKDEAKAERQGVATHEREDESHRIGKHLAGQNTTPDGGYEEVNTVKRRSYTSRAPRGTYRVNRVSNSRGRGRHVSLAEIPDTSNGGAPPILPALW